MDENYIRVNVVNTITVLFMVIFGMIVVRASSSFVKGALKQGVAVS